MGDAAAGATDDALDRSSVGTVLASVVSERCQKAPVGVLGPFSISTFYLQIAAILGALGRTRIFDLTPRWAYCRTEQYNYRFGCSKKGSASSHAVIEHLTMDWKGLG